MIEVLRIIRYRYATEEVAVRDQERWTMRFRTPDGTIQMDSTVLLPTYEPEDVPEPEPLPDLPGEVWCLHDLVAGPEEEAFFYSHSNFFPWSHSSTVRLFRATVTEWVEVTE